MLDERCAWIKEVPYKGGAVVYWMSRDQRAQDNWALIRAQEEALALRQPLIVVFCLVDQFLGAQNNAYGFMLQGLYEVSESLSQLNMPFAVLKGEPEVVLPRFLEEIDAGLLLTDQSPLRLQRGWKQKVSQVISIPFYEVDAHNIVPVFKATDKQAYGAYTLRPKVNGLLSHYLTPFHQLIKIPFDVEAAIDPVIKNLSIQVQCKEAAHKRSILGQVPGARAAHEKMKAFIDNKLERYDLRNDPNQDVCSGLSPYLHFGQISAQRLALSVIQSGLNGGAFLEELIIRRELSDNFCYYNPQYDGFDGFPNWAKDSLNAHRVDRRDYIYPLEDFEEAKTHDSLWNAAQRYLVKRGAIQGYMRMYWAKKILEWTATPEMAMNTAIYLNDRYALDGRDPNGYTGIAWSIGGVHDRPWAQRPVYGKIRYMNAAGCKRKFDVGSYIENAEAL